MYKNKLLAILFSAILCLALLPVNVFAETNSKSNEIKKVEITLTKPTIGNYIAGLSAQVTSNNEYYLDPTFQSKPVIELNNGKVVVGDLILLNEKYERGKAYRQYNNIEPKDGYSFAKDCEVVFKGDTALDVTVNIFDTTINIAYTFVAGIDNPATYRVNSFIENYDGSFNKANEVVTVYGIPGDFVTYDGNIKYDNGYYLEPYPETIIKADNSTEIDLYYYINRHKVTFDPNGEPGIEPKQITYKYKNLPEFNKIPEFEEYNNASRELECWTLNKDDDKCLYYTGDIYEVPTGFRGVQNVTLYAKYVHKHNEIENHKYVYDIALNNKEDIVIKYTTDNNSRVDSIMTDKKYTVNYNKVVVNDKDRTITIKNEYLDSFEAGKHVWTIFMVDQEGNITPDIVITINIPERTRINPIVDKNGLAKIYVWTNNEWKELTDSYDVPKEEKLKFKVDYTPKPEYGYYGIKINDNLVTENTEFELENPGDNLTIQAVVEEDVILADVVLPYHDFGKSIVGTNSATAHTFKIRNLGNQALVVTRNSLKNFDVISFVLCGDNSTVLTNNQNDEILLAPKSEAEITIKPKDNLAIGKYAETFKLYFNVKTVQPLSLTNDDSFTKEIEVRYEVVPEKVKLELSTNISGAAKLSGEGVYNSGSDVVAKAVANEGYEFIRWTEDGKEVSKDSEYKFKLDADHKLVAEFKKEAIKDDVPQTNDNSNIMLYGTIGVSALTLALYLNRKKKYSK